MRRRNDVVILHCMKPAIDSNLLNDPLFRELMAEGLTMQDRFSAEPVYAKTGRGHHQERRGGGTRAPQGRARREKEAGLSHATGAGIARK